MHFFLSWNFENESQSSQGAATPMLTSSAAASTMISKALLWLLLVSQAGMTSQGKVDPPQAQQ
jgi:hypothetical protein